MMICLAIGGIELKRNAAFEAWRENQRRKLEEDD